MFADNKYRFTLQWSADTEERCRVGQFLEKLGNKKSEIVVLALDEYLKAHPEVTTPGSKISITVQPTQTREQLQQMVRDMAKAAVTELMAGMTLVPAADEEGAESAGPSQEIIDDMLDNLDFFK